MYPVRRSNKPPYIYWKKLVIAGLILLVITVPLAIMATKMSYVTEFVEQGSVVAEGRIPKNVPPADVLVGPGAFVTNLTLRVAGCNLRYVNVAICGTNKSVVAEIRHGVASITIPGVEFLNVTASKGCNITYTYVIIKLSRPYSALAFVSALTSVAGAVMGVLGTVLFIKQRQLMKVEEKYL